MSDLEMEIITTGNRISKAKNIQEVERLYSEIKKKCENGEREGKITEKVRKGRADAIIFTINKLREFYDEWGEIQVSPNDEKEINAAERTVKEILRNIDKIDEKDFPSFFGKNHRLGAIKGMISLRLMIDAEKRNKNSYLDKILHE